MSASNGDKARFGRLRKRKLSRRVKSRALAKTLPAGKPEPAGKS